MSLERVGKALRAIRLRRGWTQGDLARRARVPRGAISRAERGHLASLNFEAVEKLARTLDAQLDVRLRWRGEELDRLLNAGHSAMHEHLAKTFAAVPEWVIAPEVSFAIWGERGVIDILAFHRPTRRLLVIELKTAIVDIQDLIGTLDCKRRLARQVARDRGWDPLGVSIWLVVADTRTNHRRVAAHRTVLGTVFREDGTRMRAWLHSPAGDVAALSYMPIADGAGTRTQLTGRKRASGPPRVATRA